MRVASASTNGRSSVSGQGPVHVSPLCGGRGIDVVASEHDLERTAAADETRESLRAAASGNDAHRDFGLREDRSTEGAEAHVERQSQFASSAAGDAFDNGDRGLGHRAEPIDHGVEQAEFRVAGGVIGGQPLDQTHVGMSGEELGISRVEHHHPNGAVRLDLAAETVELQDEREVEEVDRGMIHRRACDSASTRMRRS